RLPEVFAPLPSLAVRDRNDRPDDDVVGFQFAAILGEHGNGTILVQDDVAAVFEPNETQIVVPDGAIELGLDLRLLEDLRSHAADVERAHGELSARLPNGLRGDDANRLTQFDRRARGQIAAVTGDADAVLAFAS